MSVALKAILDKLDGVPEAQRALYVERDGRYVLDVDTESAEDAFAAGLKRNRDETLKELAAARKRLKDYDGVDRAEYERLKAAEAEAERKKAAAEGDFKALEKQLIERHTAELSGKEARISKLTQALEERLVQAELRKAIADKGGKPACADLLLLAGAKHVRVRETDQGFESFVADAAGNPQVADGKGTPMTIDLFVEQTLKVQYPDLFNGSGSSGGGASKSTAGGGGQSFVAAGDGAAFLAHVTDIAKGATQVR